MGDNWQRCMFSERSVTLATWLDEESWRDALAFLALHAAKRRAGTSGSDGEIEVVSFLNNFPRVYVRLAVDSTLLYGSRQTEIGRQSGLRAPLLMAILTLRGALEELDEEKRSGCDPDEYGDMLDLRRKGDQVDILSYDTGEYGLFNRAALLTDVRSIERQVKTFVAERLPELRVHPELGAYFRGESDRLPWE